MASGPFERCGVRDVATSATPCDVRGRLEGGLLIADDPPLDIDAELDTAGDPPLDIDAELDTAGGPLLDAGGELDAAGQVVVAKNRPRRMFPALASNWTKHSPGTAVKRSKLALLPKFAPTAISTLDWCAGSEPACGDGTRFWWTCSVAGVASGQPCASWEMSTTARPPSNCFWMASAVIVTALGQLGLDEPLGVSA